MKYRPTVNVRTVDQLPFMRLQPGQWIQIDGGITRSRYLGTNHTGTHNIIYGSVSASLFRDRARRARNRRKISDAIVTVRRAIANGTVNAILISTGMQ